MNNKNIKYKLIIILLFIILIFLILLLNINDNNLVINEDSKLYISEIMASNKKTINDFDNESSDYIEIYNEALHTGNYECCLTMLRGIESHINSVTKEKNELIKTLKRGGK